MAFLLDEEGVETVRGLYEDSAGRSVAAGALLESTLGDSLDAIEARWLEFLISDTAAPGTDHPGER
jgi:hypothetical protein